MVHGLHFAGRPTGPTLSNEMGSRIIIVGWLASLVMMMSRRRTLSNGTEWVGRLNSPAETWSLASCNNQNQIPTRPQFTRSML